MKILFLADLHWVPYPEWQLFLQLDKSRYDIICLLGDIDIMFLKSINESIPGKLILGVAGNHDYYGDLEHYEVKNMHGVLATVNNLSFFGLEGSYRYKNENAPMHSQYEIGEALTGLSYVDILISHNSPEGIHDKQDLPHKGYTALKNYISEHNPQYCIHGHQHKNIVSVVGKTTVIGVYGGIILDTNTGEIDTIISIPD